MTTRPLLICLLLSCSSPPGPNASQVAHWWLDDLRVDYVAVACTPEHQNDGCWGYSKAPCHVRLSTGEIATIWCENSEKSSTGCLPSDANDVGMLSRSPLKAEPKDHL